MKPGDSVWWEYRRGQKLFGVIHVHYTWTEPAKHDLILVVDDENFPHYVRAERLHIMEVVEL